MKKLFFILPLLFAFVIAQGQGAMFLRGSQPAPQPGAGILDNYLGAAFAAAPDVLIYSAHSVTDNTVGSQTEGQTGQFTVLVRRDNDDALRSFTYTEVANGTLATWVGPANNGFVQILYDQSTNGNHATQVTAANQPKIVNAGSLVVENGKAAIDYTTSYTFLLTPIFLPSLVQPNHFFVIYALKSLSSQVIVASSDLNARNQIFTDNSSANIMFAGESLVATTTDITQGIYSCLFNQNLSVSRRNGSQIGSRNVGSQQIRDLSIGGFSTTQSANFTGTQQIFVLYDSNQTTSQAAIETAINNEYNIFP